MNRNCLDDTPHIERKERNSNFDRIQPIDRLDHQAARKGRGQSGLPSSEVVRPCCFGLFPPPSLSHLISLTPALSGAWRIALTDCWEEVCQKSKNQSRSRFTCIFYWENCTLSRFPVCTGGFSGKNLVPTCIPEAWCRSRCITVKIKGAGTDKTPFALVEKLVISTYWHCARAVQL